jgi:hypothetical protein
MTHRSRASSRRLFIRRVIMLRRQTPYIVQIQPLYTVALQCLSAAHASGSEVTA